jgi:hypothetical protein
MARKRKLPPMDADRLRADIDAVIDQTIHNPCAPSNPERGLLETSTFVHRERVANPGDALPAQGCVSAMTLAELSLGPLLVDDPSERDTRQHHVQMAA